MRKLLDEQKKMIKYELDKLVNTVLMNPEFAKMHVNETYINIMEALNEQNAEKRDEGQR